MKKVLLGIFVGATMLTSCGEKLLSDAEMKAKVDELYNAQATKLAGDLDAECTARFEGAVTAEVDKMKMAAEAEAAAAKAAAEAEAAAAKAAKAAKKK